MKPRLGSSVVALLLGGGLLCGVWAWLDPHQLGVLWAGIGVLVALLFAARWASRGAKRRRALAFARSLAEQFPSIAALNGEARRDVYDLPWYMVLTADAASSPVMRVGATAVFVQLSALAPGSAKLLHTLRTLRARAPIAGAILAIPADRLITVTPSCHAQAAGVLGASLAALREALRVRFPVTIILTRCGALRGFREFASAMGPGHIVGWSSASPLEAAFPLTSFDEPIAAITANLRRARLSLLTDPASAGAPLARAEELFALADRVARLAVPLKTYAAALAPHYLKNGRPAWFLRGLYICSGPSMLPNVLAHRLIPERRWVCPPRRTTRPRTPVAAVAAAVLLAPVLALVLMGILRMANPSFAGGAADLSGSRGALHRSSTPHGHAGGPSQGNTPAWVRAIHDAASRAALEGIARTRKGLAGLERLRCQFPRLVAASLDSPEAVMARASALAGPDPELLALPVLPCTAASPIDARFGPQVGRDMFSSYAGIIAALPTAERGPTTEAFSAYAAEYVGAWSIAAFPGVLPAPWPQLREAIAAIQPVHVNSHARELLTAADAALGLVPSELGQESAVARVRAEIAREMETLDRPWFDEACRRSRDKWAALDPDNAGAWIIGLSPARFEADYLEVYADAAGPRSGYWSSLIVAALTSIADAGAVRADAAAFIQNTRAFPLCLSSPRTLRPSDLSAARDFAAALIRTGLSTTVPDDDQPIVRGARTKYPRINDQLARLVGETAFDADDRDLWAYRLRAVLAFLDEPQTCRLVLLDPAQQVSIDGAIPAAVLIPQFSIALGSEPPLGPYFTDRAADPGVAFHLPGPSINFSFRAAGDAVGHVDLPEPWNALWLLRQGSAMIDETTDPSGRMIKAPLFFAGPGGQRMCYWIGLRFDRPPPALAQWPSDADWPN